MSLLHMLLSQSLDQQLDVDLVLLSIYLGGYVINKIGGYDHPTTVYYVFIFGSIGIGAAVIIPFV
jgi:hypothetical protein